MKNYIKYQNTSKRIKEEFLSQFKSKPIEKITVNSICDSLAINRSTFYRHYEDIYFLLKEFENDFIEKLSQIYGYIASNNISSINTMEMILNFIKDNKEICKLFMVQDKDISLWERYNDLSVDLFLTKIFQKFPNSLNCDTDHLKQTVQFVSSGFYTLYRNWILEDCLQEVNQLANRLSNLSDSCIELVLRQN